jgi:hypothetical protein
MREKVNAYGALDGKPESKKLLGRSKRRCKYNTKTYLQETVCEVVNSIHLVQDRVVAGFCENGNEPSDTVDCSEFLDQPRNCQVSRKVGRFTDSIVNTQCILSTDHSQHGAFFTSQTFYFRPTYLF